MSCSTPLEAAATRKRRFIREESLNPNPFWTQILPPTQINQHSEHVYSSADQPPLLSQIRFSNTCQPLHLILSVSLHPVFHRPPFIFSDIAIPYRAK
ncbi:hypothetical protein ACFX2J_027550 [Malus domestica]